LLLAAEDVAEDVAGGEIEHQLPCLSYPFHVRVAEDLESLSELTSRLFFIME
jgi:hypothetical protein